MTIRFRCACGKKLKVDDKFSGTKGKCPQCGGVVEIPEIDISPPSANERTNEGTPAAMRETPSSNDAERPNGGGSTTEGQSVGAAVAERDDLPSYDELGGRFDLPPIASARKGSRVNGARPKAPRTSHRARVPTPPSPRDLKIRLEGHGGSGVFSWLGLSSRKRGFHIAAGVLFCVYALFNIVGGFAAFGKGDWEGFKHDTAAGVSEGFVGFAEAFSTPGQRVSPELQRLKSQARNERMKGGAKKATFYAVGILCLALAGLNITSGVGLFASSGWAAKVTFLTAVGGIGLDVANNVLAGFGPLIILYLAINGFAIFACIDN